MSHIGKPPCDEGAILHGTAATQRTASQKRWTLVAATLGTSMAFVDGTVVNVALPALQRGLDASAAQAQWVIEAYALFLAALLLVGGALGDRYGRRLVFMIGVAVFTAASLACALSPSVHAVIAARALQGAGAALLVPGSLALISATFGAAERGTAIGTWSAFSGIAAAIGPTLGGYLVDHFSWTWAFLINAPIGAALLVMCAARVPESRGPASGRGVDRLGAGLATTGLAGVVYALTEVAARGWTAPQVWASLALGGGALAAFARVEARAEAPMLPLALFRIRNFGGANLLTLLLYAALGGGLYFVPLNLIQVQGYGAAAAGAALLPFVAIMFALSRWAGRLVDSVGAKLPLVIGPLVAGAGFALFTAPAVGGGYWHTFAPAVCVLGLGMAITVAPLTTTVMNSVGPDLAGVASGVNNAISRAAALLAIAVFGIVMASGFDRELGAQLAHMNASQAVVDALANQRDKLAGMVLPAGLGAAENAQIQHAIGRAFVSGFRSVMLVCVALSLAGALSAWWMIEDAPAAKTGRA